MLCWTSDLQTRKNWLVVLRLHNLCCSECQMVGFRILREGIKASSRFTILDFRRADFHQLGRILWDMVLDRRVVWEIWLTFKDHLLQALEQFILMYMDEHGAHDRTLT